MSVGGSRVYQRSAVINRQEDFPAVVKHFVQVSPANFYFPHVYSIKITFETAIIFVYVHSN